MANQHKSNSSPYDNRRHVVLIALFFLVVVVSISYSAFMGNPLQSILFVIVLAWGVVILNVLRQHEKRHQADIRELQLKEENLNTIFNSIGDAVIVTDIHGKISRFNPVAADLTAWPIKEALGEPLEAVFCIVNAQTNEPAVNPVKRVFDTGKIIGLANHTMLIARDGSQHHIADSAAPVIDTDGKITGVVLVFRNVTEKYQMRKAIRESEQFLQSVFRAAPTGIGVVCERKLKQVNEKICEMTGYSQSDLIGRSTRMLYQSDTDYDYVGREKYDQINDHGTGTVETQWKCKDGSIIDVLLSSTPLDNDDLLQGVTFTALDITGRKRVEKELQLSLKKFEKTFQTSPVMTVLISMKDRRYIEVNETFLEVMGYRQDEVVGKKTSELQSWVNPEDHQLIIARINEGKAIRHMELQRRTKTGKIIETLLSAQSFWLEDGEFLVSVIQDVTRWKQSENDKIKLEEQFKQMEKLESIGRLAGGVAHDLNNLLSPIIGYAEMLLEDTPADDKRSESIQEIVNAGVRARNLVHQLLAFSRKQPLEYKQINMNKVATGVEKLIRRTIREDIAIEIVTAQDTLIVQADVGQIEQMILNIVTNASDAMPDGGKITIETSQMYLDEEYVKAHRGVKPGEYVMLSVSDTGCGMDEKTRQQIFEPFFSTKGNQGTGLGLATVYGIAKQHGGNIWVYSELGKGTTFKIFLPLSEQPHSQKQKTEKIIGNRGGDEVILLVEDNEQVRNLVFTILKRKGYTVLVAENGDDALAQLHQHKGPLHLMLTDVVMPGMNGKELFNRVIVDHQALKVIYMSGYTSNVIAHRGILDEGIAFIQKPFSTQDLAAKVRDVLDSKA